MIHGDEKFFCSVFSNPLRAWILSLLLQEISPQLKKKDGGTRLLLVDKFEPKHYR